MTKTATTKGITISVETFYYPDQSRPNCSEYIFAYRIHITNHSLDTVQLLSRHWHIFDSNGMKREVQGEGVVGEQPILMPDETHEYSSACYLETEIGKMHGSYLMERFDGSQFTVRIPAFQMIVPYKLN